MIINFKFTDTYQAGQACLKRQLEIDDLQIKDITYPIPKYKPTQIKWTETAKSAFKSQLRQFIP